MLRSLWIAKTGMEAQQTQLDTISHNLANVATNGYKKSHAVFEDLMYQNLRQAGANSSEQTQLPTGLQVGLGVRAAATTRNFTQGALTNTGGSTDVAPVVRSTRVTNTGEYYLELSRELQAPLETVSLTVPAGTTGTVDAQLCRAPEAGTLASRRP